MTDLIGLIVDGLLFVLDLLTTPVRWASRRARRALPRRRRDD